MRRIVAALAMTLALAVPATAEVSDVCVTQFQSNERWSEPKPTDVRFMSGIELNKVTGTFSFEPYKPYAFLRFALGEVGVIRLETDAMIRGRHLESRDLNDLFATSTVIEGLQVNGAHFYRWRFTRQVIDR